MADTPNASKITLKTIIEASEDCGNSVADRKKKESALYYTLQTALNASSKDLEKLLENGEVDIVNLTKSTAYLEEHLALAKARLFSVRESLQTAKEKLMGELLEEGNEKRAQFLAAYTEDRANQATLELLVRVEKLAALPETVKQNIENRQTLRAEEGVLKGLHQLEQGDEYGPLVEVEALKEVHSTLLEYQRELTTFSSSDELTTSTLDTSTEDDARESSVPRYIQLPMLPATSSEETTTPSLLTADEASNISFTTTTSSSSSEEQSSSGVASSSEIDYSSFFAKRNTVLQQASEHFEEAITSIINTTSIKFSAN